MGVLVNNQSIVETVCIVFVACTCVCCDYIFGIENKADCDVCPGEEIISHKLTSW